jgi:hypothetical protein
MLAISLPGLHPNLLSIRLHEIWLILVFFETLSDLTIFDNVKMSDFLTLLENFASSNPNFVLKLGVEKLDLLISQIFESWSASKKSKKLCLFASIFLFEEYFIVFV